MKFLRTNFRLIVTTAFIINILAASACYTPEKKTRSAQELMEEGIDVATVPWINKSEN